MLVLANNERIESYVKLAIDAFDKLTFFINPEAHAAVKSIEKTGALPNQTVNADYVVHSRSAAKTGKPTISKDMQKALDKIYKDGSVDLSSGIMVDLQNNSEDLGD